MADAAPSRQTAALGGIVDGSRAAGPAAYRAEIDEAELIRRYVPTVKRLAAHLKGRLPQSVQLDDLVQAGLIAVLRIARRTDCPHIAEAMLRRSIVNAMIDEARRVAWAPTRILRLATAAAAAMQAVRKREGRDGSDEEVATELRISLDQYHQILVDSAGISLVDLASLDDVVEPALHTAGNQEDDLGRNRVTAALAASIAALPARERIVVSLYYEQELNMEEVGEVLGLDKSTISRSHGRALLMLRSALADWGTAPDPSRHRSGD
jgi:RNA polymerase sigma factor for flagellar operon FliA